jgi:hypothetical protein
VASAELAGSQLERASRRRGILRRAGEGLSHDDQASRPGP